MFTIRTDRRHVRWLPSFLVLAALTALLAVAQPASAANPSPYCGGQTLGGHESCIGAIRNFVALEGWGANHSVCVFYYTFGGTLHNGTCSGGPGQHTYWPASDYGKPGITNNAWGTNLVNGVAWQ